MPTSWTRDWGLSPVPAAWLNGYGAQQLQDNPVIRRREMVFVNGQLMTPFTDQAAMASTSGSFYVDESGNRLLVRPPSGVSMSSATGGGGRA